MSEDKINKEDKKIKKQIQDTKYKIWLFIIILLSFIYFWDFESSFTDLNVSKENFDSKISENKQILSDIKNIENNIDTVSIFTEKSSEFVDCINDDECVLDSVLQDLWIEFSKEISNDVIRNFFLLRKHEYDKMDYDQALILKNINEYLLDFQWSDLNIVSFSNVVKSNSHENMYTLPITLNITVKNLDWLIDFLKNVEESVGVEYPVLYEIEAINYDIVKSDEEQSISVNLLAYFIK